MEANDKIAAVHRYVEAFDKADMDIIRDIYSVDARVEDPVGTAPHEGKVNNMRAYWGPENMQPQ